MPLLRLGEDAYRVDLEGVAFGMLVVGEGRTQRCLVTYEALTDAMGGVPTQDEQVQWFMANRSDIEEVASDKFDNRLVEPDGFVVVTSQD